MIDTFGAIGTRIEFSATKLNFLLAKLAGEAWQTTARVRFNSINTCSIVLTFVVIAVINIEFTARTFIPGQALATETTFFQHCALSVVSARISVASVNHVFAVLAMIAWSASTFVLSVCLHHAFSVVLAREGEACITFRQNLITDFLFANELVRRRR